MKLNLFRSLPLAVVLLASGEPARAEAESYLVCGHGRLAWASPDSADYRKYAPSREVDVLHLALDVTPDFKARTVSGRVTLRFKPIARSLSELSLDGIDLRVSEVTSSETLASWSVSPDKVRILFAKPIPADRETTVTVVYSAEPKQGLYFRTPEMGYKAGDTHVWTQGEPLEARHWFPSFDAPNEKFTSDVTCRVPSDMVVLSNGRLASEEKDPATGLKVVTWRQEKPHANYLIALVAGYVAKIEDRYRDIPLAFYTPASQIEHAKHSFGETRDMMEFFEKEIGVPYPWAKYYQVCVEDFGWGGMENTSLTILNDRTLAPAEFGELRSSRGLVAHELAHQWFGDLVTCKDWSHLWLNEGFATYYTHLYEGHKLGRDEMLYGLYQSAQGIASQPNDTNAIVRRDFNQPEEQFGFHAYPKGSWILHMLRNQLGEELYRRCIRTYLERHQFGNAVTEDLNRVIEELSGRSFDQFFDQYVYHAHHPELSVTYSWDEKTRLAKIAISQNQKLSDDVLLFNVPLTIRFKGKFGTEDREVIVKDKAGDFYFPLPQAPEQVRIDPNVALLARITFNPPTPMLLAQLADATDTIGRLIAAEQLSGRREALPKLKETLNGDPFHGVRLACATSIRALQSDDAFNALLESTKQEDPRVRRQVINDVAGFYREPAYDRLLAVLREEKNPDIRAAALVRLGSWAKPEVREQILAALGSGSHHSVLEDAALSAARAQDDASYVAPLLEALGRNEAAMTSGVFARGLDILAWLSRNEDKKDAVREFLLARVNSSKQRVKLAAIGGLGTLGDPRSAAMLEKFSMLPRQNPERGVAERALMALRETRKPSAELGGIRTELLNLQRENKDLRKELDDLKKRFDALAPQTPDAKGAKAAKAGPKPVKR